MNDIERRPAEARAAEAAVSPQRWLVLTAFGIVYVVWGSTYLAILFAIESMPPFLMASTRFLRSLLFGVEPTDPLTLVLVVIVLATVTLGACLVPALRALRIDPMAALRSD